MSTPQVSAEYQEAGRWHQVLVARDPAGRWQVIDSDGSQATLIETLTGHDDRLHQAQALARDYAEQQQAYHDGEREANPLPHGREQAERSESTAVP